MKIQHWKTCVASSHTNPRSIRLHLDTALHLNLKNLHPKAPGHPNESLFRAMMPTSLKAESVRNFGSNPQAAFSPTAASVAQAPIGQNPRSKLSGRCQACHLRVSRSTFHFPRAPSGCGKGRTDPPGPEHTTTTHTTAATHHDGHYYLKGRSWEKKDPWPWPEPKVDARLGLQQRPLYSGSSGEAEARRLSRAGRSPAKEASNAWVAPSGPSSSQRKGAVTLLWQGHVQGLESDGV